MQSGDVGESDTDPSIEHADAASRRGDSLDAADHDAAAQRDAREERDRAWLDAIRDGDMAAYGKLYVEYWGTLYGMAWSRVCDDQDAGDVVQDVFSALLQLGQNWNVRTSVATYLLGAVRNRSIDLLKRRRREQSTNERRSGSDSAVGDSGEIVLSSLIAFSSGEARAMRGDILRIVTETLDAMTPQRRDVFLLHLDQEKRFSYAEIAAAVGVSRSTVRQHILHAWDALREPLARGGFPNILRRQDDVDGRGGHDVD